MAFEIKNSEAVYIKLYSVAVCILKLVKATAALSHSHANFSESIRDRGLQSLDSEAPRNNVH